MSNIQNSRSFSSFVKSFFASLFGKRLFIGVILFAILGSLFPGINDFFMPVAKNIVIILMFFFSGILLPEGSLGKNLVKWREHLFIQIMLFIISPSYYFSFLYFLGDLFPEGLRIGIIILAVLPTTISSAAALTSLAGGNQFLSVFNSGLSNSLAIVISPLLLSLVLMIDPVNSLNISPLPVFLSFFLKAGLPMIAGRQLEKITSIAEKSEQYLKTASNILILLLVFLTVNQSRAYLDLMFRDHKSWFPLVLLVSASSLFFLIAYPATRIVSRVRSDRIALHFTGTQKTLAMAIPLLNSFFSENKDIMGSAMVTLLISYLWQIFTGSVWTRFINAKQELFRPSKSRETF